MLSSYRGLTWEEAQPENRLGTDAEACLETPSHATPTLLQRLLARLSRPAAGRRIPAPSDFRQRGAFAAVPPMG
jgi:hypothetical protein